MIFVTVGTHEQQFNRVVKYIDDLVANNRIVEDVFVQSGYCTYKPQHVDCQEHLSFNDMEKYAKSARIIITHGGPGSIFLALQRGKIPIVVPRNPRFDEHVDEHQILFTKRLVSQKKVIGIYEIEKLGETIEEYNNMITSLNADGASGKEEFISKLKRYTATVCSETRILSTAIGQSDHDEG